MHWIIKPILKRACVIGDKDHIDTTRSIRKHLWIVPVLLREHRNTMDSGRSRTLWLPVTFDIRHTV